MKKAIFLLLLGLGLGLWIGLSVAGRRGQPKQFLNGTAELPPGYTYVVTSPPGRMLFLSGRAGQKPDGTWPPDFETQCRNTFEELKRCLALGGATFKDVVKVDTYVTDLSNLGTLRRIRAGYLDQEHPPASTTVQTGLMPGQLLEIEVVATLPE